MKDLFEQTEKLPKEVITLLENFEPSYTNCKLLVEQLNKIGYTCDYGLDAQPYELHKLKHFKTFKQWRDSDNVVEVVGGKFKTQCSQYSKAFTHSELYNYYIKEYK